MEIRTTDFIKEIENIEFSTNNDNVTLSKSDLFKLLNTTYSEGASWQREWQNGTINSFDKDTIEEIITDKLLK